MISLHPGLKEKIAANFTAKAPYYDHHATLQQLAAKSLAKELAKIKAQVPAGPALEVGCGTGAVSKELLAMFPDRRLTLIDLAPGMIEHNRATLTPLIMDHPRRIDWQVGDAETLDTRNHYALAASCLTLQWFNDIHGSLDRLCAALVPQGILLCSYLGDQSFPEWRQAASALNLPCTANPLPNGQRILNKVLALGHQAWTWEEMTTISYPSAHDFFRSLKKTGTSTSTRADRLTRGQMARLINGWQGRSGNSVTVTYQINTLLVRR